MKAEDHLETTTLHWWTLMFGHTKSWLLDGGEPGGSASTGRKDMEEAPRIKWRWHEMKWARLNSKAGELERTDGLVSQCNSLESSFQSSHHDLWVHHERKRYVCMYVCVFVCVFMLIKDFNMWWQKWPTLCKFCSGTEVTMFHSLALNLIHT